MPDAPVTHQGYLIIADISGYTAFLQGTEVDHAAAIIGELTALIRARLVPLRFVKLEGDAVFCFADAGVFEDGERLVELLESCYMDFLGRLFDMVRATTCPCAACAAIESLDLKFVAHFGSYVIQAQRTGGVDLIGPDVILAHRLLKNDVTELTGCRAYVFFTHACLGRMPAWFSLPAHTETVESFGATAGGVHDLARAAATLREAQRVYISTADADFEIGGEAPGPPAVLWQWCVDPDKRARWVTNERSVVYRPNARGRLGAGATSHCAHRFGQDALRHYVDWRPFEYFTNRMTSPRGDPQWTEMYEFTPLDDGGSRACLRIRLDNRSLATRLGFRLVVAPLLRAYGFRRAITKLARILEEEAPAGSAPAANPRSQ